MITASGRCRSTSWRNSSTLPRPKRVAGEGRETRCTSPSPTTSAPAAVSRSDAQTGAVALSTAARLPESASSAGPNASGGWIVTSGPRWARTASSNLAGAANSSTRPSSRSSAKA